MTSNEIFEITALLGIVVAAFLAHLTIKKIGKHQTFFRKMELTTNVIMHFSTSCQNIEKNQEQG